MTAPDPSLLPDLAAATEGSRALDERIERALYPEMRLARDAQDRWRTEDGIGTFIALGEYTISLDATKEALPSGTLWAFGCMEHGPFARAVIPMPDGSYVGAPDNEAEANTAELAACIVMLRARGIGA